MSQKSESCVRWLPVSASSKQLVVVLVVVIAIVVVIMRAMAIKTVIHLIPTVR